MFKSNRSHQVNRLKRKLVYLFLIIFLVTSESFVHAQHSTKIPRIGYLATVPLGALADNIEGLTQGLRELGYVDGKTILIEWRSAGGKLDRLPALATELVSLKVDAIISTGGVVTRAAKTATSSIPIVMANDADPVANGFIASLARPGGNITGLSAYAPELGGKRLEILREVNPRISRVAVLGTSTGPGNTAMLETTEQAAIEYKVQLHYLDVLSPMDIKIAVRDAVDGGAEALIVLGSYVLYSQRARIGDFAVKHRLPAIYHSRVFAEDGGLMSYGASYVDLHRRAATYVDKILKGIKPADIPVERPLKAEFIINLKAADKIGLTIPPVVLQRADKVIE